jgi:hypothetical protein
MTPAHHPKAATADGTASEARQQVLRLDVTSPNTDSAATRLNQTRADALKASMCELPLVVRDDSERRRRRSNPFGLWSRVLILLTPGVTLLCPIPDHLSQVEASIQDLLHG